jgi:hypothetical protein
MIMIIMARDLRALETGSRHTNAREWFSGGIAWARGDAATISMQIPVHLSLLRYWLVIPASITSTPKGSIGMDSGQDLLSVWYVSIDKREDEATPR